MATPLIFLLALLFILYFPLSYSSSATLRTGAFISVENADNALISADGVFTAGFFPVGDNAYLFGIWFTKPPTVIWTANRNQPVNGKRSKLALLQNGNLVLTDAGQFIVWTSNTVADSSSVRLKLNNVGNLVLLKTSENRILWQSFDSPTNTLLPHQPFTRNTVLISPRSQTNFSLGYYKLTFDNDNVFRLLFDGPEVSSAYWPEPWIMSWQAGRPTYNSTRLAMLDSFGQFTSSDTFQFVSTDFGSRFHRRLVLDSDGNLRLYSLVGENWGVTWQAISIPCFIHGVCGPNSLCGYIPTSGRKCSCIPGFKMVNYNDWSFGCEPEFSLPCHNTSAEVYSFIHLPYVDFYGNDYKVLSNYTFDQCREECLKLNCSCKGFQYVEENPGQYNCYPKLQLINGHHFPSFKGDFYAKLLLASNKRVEKVGVRCSGTVVQELERTYLRTQQNGPLRFMMWFASAVGGVELIAIFLVWFFFVRTHRGSGRNAESYHIAPTGFKRYTYDELKKATKNFSEEIGRGAGGTVYKGTVADNRIAAIKKLNDANQGEDEFLAEVGTVGKLNHMYLIEMWGYCAERKHRLLVYEYMEHGSLAEKLSSPALDWNKRFEIALGTAKGLAYLHEECLEWVLHCDVKPQNILLDSNYQPKVADFGLSKLLNRGDMNNSCFSRIRGTRGYMAPEWVFHSRITSKVDVYSYGIVVLEMVTGKSPTAVLQSGEIGKEKELRSLVSWVRDKKNGASARESWAEDIIDPSVDGKYEMKNMQVLVEVALQCVEEDKDARPTMSQVVETLLHHES